MPPDQNVRNVHGITAPDNAVSSMTAPVGGQPLGVDPGLSLDQIREHFYEGILKPTDGGQTEQDAEASPPTEELLEEEAGEEAERGEEEEAAEEAEEGEEGPEEEEEEEEPGPEDEEEDEEEGKPEDKAQALPNRYLDHAVSLPDGTRMTVRQLIGGNMMRQDYSRKTAELARSREQLQQAQAELQEVWQFSQILEANPHVGDTLLKLLAGDFDGAQETFLKGVEAAKNQPPYDPRIDRLEQMLFQQRVEEIEKRLLAEAKEIQEKYPDVDMDFLAQQAMLRKDQSLWDTFKVVYFDKALTKAKKKGSREEIRRQKKGASAPTSMREGKSVPQKPSPGPIDSAQAAARYYNSL